MPQPSVYFSKMCVISRTTKMSTQNW